MSDNRTPPRVDVIVPVHGGWAFVRRCLAALQEQTVPVNVIVVDDKSPDDTLSQLRREFGSLTIIANETNFGFSVSCNRGIRAGVADIVVLLNSDVVAVPDFAAQTIAAFERAGDRIGSIAPVLLSTDGTVDSFGITADATGAGYVRYHGAAPAQIDATAPSVLGPYGAAAAYRRRALDESGLLDENIFMYGEELELALRLRAAGWDAIASPYIAGTHIGGASSGKASSRQLYLSAFGRGYLLRVYDVLRGRHAFTALVSEAAVTLVWTVTRRDLIAWRGRRDGWRAGRAVARRRIVPEAVDGSIGLFRGLRMRQPGYWRRS